MEQTETTNVGMKVNDRESLTSAIEYVTRTKETRRQKGTQQPKNRERNTVVETMRRLTQ